MNDASFFLSLLTFRNLKFIAHNVYSFWFLLFRGAHIFQI